MKRRVVITGIGAVTPLGFAMESVWDKMQHGQSAIRENDFPGKEAFPHSLCARVDETQWRDYIPNQKMIKLMNRETQMAVAAAGLALGDARANGFYLPERTGIFMGTGLTSGEMEDLLPVLEHSFDANGRFSYRLLGQSGLPNCNPLLSFKILTNMALCHISMMYDIRGDNLIFSPWPGNTAQAVIAGVKAVEWGEADFTLVGGCDSKAHFIGFLTFSQLGLLSKNGCCRPFAKDSDGMILGEGAAVLALETLDNARQRNASLYAEIVGCGEATDAVSATLYPEQSVFLKRAMAEALSEAGLKANEIDCICCSAGSHPSGDRQESVAIASLFPQPPLLSSLKPFCGDLVAASPALTLCTGAYAIKNQFLPPALQPENSDPEIPLQYGGCRFTSGRLPTIMVNAFDLGSTKASMVIRGVS